MITANSRHSLSLRSKPIQRFLFSIRARISVGQILSQKSFSIPFGLPPTSMVRPTLHLPLHGVNKLDGKDKDSDLPLFSWPVYGYAYDVLIGGLYPNQKAEWDYDLHGYVGTKSARKSTLYHSSRWRWPISGRLWN
jgi:hypothetical protein